ncbi:MAG: MafI family immunity protein [Chloroflexi bacterium]|nr:MafI family immunity protein [Chloroflexota bacterium]
MSMDSIEKDLNLIAEVFTERLPDLYIQDVKELAGFREWGLAFRVLCDQLFEFDVKITKEEWEKINLIGKLMKIDLHDGYNWSKLKELIQTTTN